MKKCLQLILIFISVLFAFSNNVLAYEFKDPTNEEKVNNMITEIYDNKYLYESLMGGYVEEVSIKSVTQQKYMWPIGSDDTTIKNDILYAIGDPASINVIKQYDISNHKGIDISKSYNVTNNVIAANAGTVVYPVNEEQKKVLFVPSDSESYGNYVVIQHSDGSYAYYANLAYNSITVSEGDVVSRGQVIGQIDETNNYLHFEIRTSSTYGTQKNPFQHIDANDPRPIASSTDGFSLTSTVLTRSEFIVKMEDYCNRSGITAFCNNFSSKAGEIYDASIAVNVNPELVVVTAGTEQGWKNCGTTNNYWGIGIYNGKTCSSGPHYSSISEGIAGYAEVLASYQEGGKMANLITNTYNNRLNAGADPNGIGLPGTFTGMQMIYSSLGTHSYGSSGSGGYYYMDPDRAGVTTIYETHQEFLDKCYNAGGEHAAGTPVTAWEQSRYTIWQMSGKTEFRQKIFGL